MRHLDDGEVNRAWVDLLACHRLARLTGQGPMLVHYLASIADDGRACAADAVMLQNVRLTVAQAAKLRADLATLPPLPKMSDKIERGERFVYLDSVAMVAREGIGLLQELEGPFGRRSDLVRFLSNDDARAAVDWGMVLRDGNKWYDRHVEAGRKPTRAERTHVATEDRRRSGQSAKGSQRREIPCLASAAEARQGVSEKISLSLATLLLPAGNWLSDPEDRGTCDSI